MKLMVLTRRDGAPSSALAAAADRGENQLVEPLLERSAERGVSQPEVLIGDRAYDDDSLRDRLKRRGTFLLAPHRRGRKRPPRHDGRHLRRYWRRYLAERAHAWLQNFRRLVIRYDWYRFIYEGFVALACLIIVARML